MTDDQKRALGLGGVALTGVFLYRRMHRGGRNAAQAAAAASFNPAGAGGNVQPYTPQAPLPLQPGESVYDPNSEALLNTPNALPPPTQVAAPAAPAYTVNVNYPHTAGPPPKQGKVGAPAGPHGALVAPPGAKPPPAKKGFSVVGVGHGQWIYKPVPAPRQPAKKK